MSGGFKTWGSTEVPTAANFNTYLRDQMNMNFDTVSARNSALSSPQAGMMCYCADTGEVYIRSSSTWRSAWPRIFYTTADKDTTDSVTPEAIPGLSIPVEASSTYLLNFDIGFITNNASNDIRFAWSTPSGAGGNWYLAGMDPASSSAFYPEQFRGDTTWGSQLALGAITTGRTFARGRGYLTTSSTAGSVVMQHAEGFAQAGTTWARVIAGSSIYIRKIA